MIKYKGEDYAVKRGFKQRNLLRRCERGEQRGSAAYLSERLFQLGLVTEEYGTNVIMREQKYPTGLPLEGRKVAIPHTDAVYVKETRNLCGCTKNTR